MNEIALIACCKKKLTTSAIAAELYQGQLFKAQLAYAHTLVEDGRICVASAEHYLVGLGQKLDPYELSLRDMAPYSRRAWAREVVRQLWDMYPGRYLYVYLLAGGLYEKSLAPEFARFGITFGVPHPARLGYGQQVKWYREALC